MFYSIKKNDVIGIISAIGTMVGHMVYIMIDILGKIGTVEKRPLISKTGML